MKGGLKKSVALREKVIFLTAVSLRGEGGGGEGLAIKIIKKKREKFF